jgi:hypothetical protein
MSNWIIPEDYLFTVRLSLESMINIVLSCISIHLIQGMFYWEVVLICCFVISSSAIEREDIIITDTFVSLLTIFVEKGALGSLKVTLITMLCIMPRGIYIYHSARCGHINIPQSHKVFERDRLARINQNMLLDLI